MGKKLLTHCDGVVSGREGILCFENDEFVFFKVENFFQTDFDSVRSGVNVMKLFSPLFTSFRAKLECSSLASLSSLL